MNYNKNGFYPRYAKRALDFLCAALALLLLFWLIVLVGILVRVKLGGPVLFRQMRPGKNGRLFCLLKFRTMTDARDADGRLLPDRERLTPFGRRLRGSSLDELPQLWNVLRGDMSLVGPRPQLVRDLVFMTEAQKRRHTVRPGLTGLAQVSGRNALAWDRKLEKDLEYVDGISLRLDLSILRRTVAQVVFHKTSLPEGEADEIDLTDDLGVFLRKRGELTQEEFDAGLLLAEQLLRRETGGGALG